VALDLDEVVSGQELSSSTSQSNHSGALVETMSQG